MDNKFKYNTIKKPETKIYTLHFPQCFPIVKGVLFATKKMVYRKFQVCSQIKW